MHSILPRRITAMRSDITSASSWLCVTSSVLTFKLRMNAPQLDLHLLAQRGIEIGQGLVQQKKIGARDKRARERHTLLHAAGQLRGKFLLDARQAHEVEHLASRAARFP